MKTIFISFLSNLRFYITILLVFASSSIYSIDCRLGLTSTHYHNATLVILGTIVDKVDIEENMVEIHLDIQEDFKGTNVDCILIDTHHFQMPFGIGDQVLYMGPDDEGVYTYGHYYGCITHFLVLRDVDAYQNNTAFLIDKTEMDLTLQVIRFTKSFNSPKFCYIPNEKEFRRSRYYGSYYGDQYRKSMGKVELILYQLKIEEKDKIQIIMEENSRKYYEIVKEIYDDLELVCIDDIYNGTSPVGILYIKDKNIFRGI